MVKLRVKKGSMVQIPIPGGWAVSSDKPQFLTATITGGVVILAALAPGDAWVTIDIAGDLQVRVLVSVVP
jgi:hypothetical protein